MPDNFEELLQETIQLKREVPSRSVNQIIMTLELEERVPPGVLKRSTLQRFLLNYRFDSGSPMALVLVGQTELWEDKLRHRRYDAIRQSIDIACVLPHLDRSETAMYIDSHLRYAGCESDIFSDRAIDEIHKGSSGIPRQINRICEKCLLYGSQQQKRIIDGYMVQHIIEHESLTVGGAL